MDYLNPMDGLEEGTVGIDKTSIPAKAPDGFGQFSKDKPEEEKTVEDYVAEFEKYAALQDQVAANTAGVDPRGRTSRAQRALKNIFSASSAYTGSSTEGREKGAQSAQDDIFTLLDPTAWIQDKTSVEDPGSPSGQFSYEKAPNLTPGQLVTTSDGKQWRFVRRKRVDNYTVEGALKQSMVNVFDFVGDAKLQQEIAQGYKENDLLRGAENFLGKAFGGGSKGYTPVSTVNEPAQTNY